MLNISASASNPTYLTISALDRNEYTAKASTATGTFTGNGHTCNLSTLSGDGRSASITFTLQANGRYYNSTYGYFDQLTFNTSGSLDDITNLAFYTSSSASNLLSTYVGSGTVATISKPVETLTQATPDSIANAAASFVGQAWNDSGCWVLASAIGAEAGASVSVTSTSVGTAGSASGEWIVAYNGPVSANSNWVNLVKAGEMIVFEPAGGGGHITTCVSGSGSSAMLIDNAAFGNSNGTISNSANDGSANDIIIQAAHAASAEFAGVSASTVVIYELDCPIVTGAVASDALTEKATVTLGTLFTATDPSGKAVTSWQVYNTLTGDTLVLNGTTKHANSAATAITTTSLGSLSLVAGTTVGSDVVEVRAFNGSYWGDWTTLNVTVSAPVVVVAPVLLTQTTTQTNIEGVSETLTLSNAFSHPSGEIETYSATLSSGAALPSWMVLNSTTGILTITSPTSLQAVNVTVKASVGTTSASETFAVNVVAEPPQLMTPTLTQTWGAGQAVSLSVASAFKSPTGAALTYTAKQLNGSALPSWLKFNTTTDTFSGTAPSSAQSLSILVQASNGNASNTETFTVNIDASPPVIVTPTPTQTWNEGATVSLSVANTFVDPKGENLTYSATLANGQALPTWLKFNSGTGLLTGTAPTTAQSLSVVLKATDAVGLSTSETVALNVVAPKITVANTPNQIWADGSSIGFTVPTSAFTDSAGSKMTFTAAKVSGADATWLNFNAASDELFGVVPTNLGGTIAIAITATDTTHGITATDMFNVTFGKTGNITQVTPSIGLGQTETLHLNTLLKFDA
ncbi:unnamed protein product [Sphagnum tenellum]